jgi:hypothetical protein
MRPHRSAPNFLGHLKAAALLLLLGGTSLVYAQGAKFAAIQTTTPVKQIHVMRPSSAPSDSSKLHAPFMLRAASRTNLTPVNTGPGIVYTCDPNVATATCTYLNTTVAGWYNGTFTNANASIYILYGTTGLGSSTGYGNSITYGNYVAALNSNPNKSAIQTSALSALSTYDAGPYGSGNVGISGALGTTLGFAGLTGITVSQAACTLPSAGCYDEIITITNDPGTPLYYDNLGGAEPAGAYDFYTTVAHETDEVLGTSSCISTQGPSLSDGCGAGVPSVVDLFRYSSAGNLVLDSSLSTTPGAYFSYNGGSTNGANGKAGTPKVYNTLNNGDDYADFLSSSPDCGTNQAVQDAEGCPGEDAGLSILNDGGAEINILTTVGYQVPATSACTTPNPNPNPNPESFAAQGDFNGDCKSDILWDNPPSGEVYQWLMNGTAVASEGSPGSVASPPWAIRGIGDFDGDGKADILWQNTTTGEVYIWLMNGTTVASQGSPGTIASGWNIVGVGDFNGDGKADILWQNTTSGQVYIWLMNGTTLTAGGSPGTVASGWNVVGVGDFDGDGKADILWQNSTSGQIYIWLMNGTTLTSAGSPGSVAPSSGWAIQGVGDFDGNGKSDILWQNTTSGQVYIWLMNGATVASEGSPGSVTTGWNVVGIGDYDGTGKADILWQNSTSGQVYIWLMNGTAVASQGSPGTITPSSGWQITPLSL